MEVEVETGFVLTVDLALASAVAVVVTAVVVQNVAVGVDTAGEMLVAVYGWLSVELMVVMIVMRTVAKVSSAR